MQKIQTYSIFKKSFFIVTVKKLNSEKNWCLQTMVMEKIPESPLDSKEIKPVNLKGDQPWLFTGRTDAEAEAPVCWSCDVNRWLIRKVSDAGKVWRQMEKRASEDEMAGQHHWCNEHEQTLGDGEGQGGKSAAVLTVWLNNNSQKTLNILSSDAF